MLFHDDGLAEIVSSVRSIVAGCVSARPDRRPSSSNPYRDKESISSSISQTIWSLFRPSRSFSGGRFIHRGFSNVTNRLAKQNEDGLVEGVEKPNLSVGPLFHSGSVGLVG